MVNKLCSINKKNQKNNVDKQLAETVSFKRNVIGSFIENVDAEFNAKKNMNKSNEELYFQLKEKNMEQL